MRNLFSIGLLVALLIGVWPSQAQEMPLGSTVPASRLARLSSGVNLTGWFWYAQDDLEDVKTYFTADDMAKLREWGLTFVRVPIDLGFVMDASAPDLLNAEHLAVLDASIQMILDADLGVIVDLHSTSLADSNAANYSASLEDPAFFEQFKVFWSNFATHLTQYDPEWVFFEPMNEPVFYDNPSEWEGLQIELLAAIRQVAPEHTLIATSARWSGLETFVQLEPLDDPNIIYNFHFYEPFPFTHQGASWSSDEVKPLRNVPYPSSPEAIATASLAYENASARAMLEDYGQAQENRETLRARIQTAVDWAERYQVPLLCNEFGAYKEFTPAADRALWVQDVRTIFEEFGIGWAMWDYDSNFGLTIRMRSGQHVIDPAIASALGLALD